MKFLDHKVNAKALLKEIEFFLEHSDLTHGSLSNGAVITTDVGYVCEFFEDLLQEFSKTRKDIK